jgi:CRP/FNR family transcriptional regulator
MRELQVKSIDKQEILSRTSLLQNVSGGSMLALADICLPKNLKKKERLFVEGDKAFFLYVLVTGSVQLFKTSPRGRDVVIKVVKPGEMFAEAILFESDRYPVSAVALKTGLAYQIPKHQFNCLLEKKDFRNDFLRGLMLKLRFLAEQIQYLTVQDVEDRLRLFIGQQFGHESRFMPGMSKKDIAAAIGVTPETVSRLFVRLGEEGKLKWAGREIVIDYDAWDAKSRSAY